MAPTEMRPVHPHKPLTSTITPVKVVVSAIGLCRSVGRSNCKLGDSQEALTERCGLHWTFVGQVERGRYNVSLYNIFNSPPD